MIVCLACYQDRLATVFENAAEFRFYEARDKEFYPAGQLTLPSKDPTDRTSALAACGVNLVLCGALCAREADLLRNAGVEVRGWLRGSVSDALKALAENRLDSLAMPGCRRCRGRHGNQAGRFGRRSNGEHS